MDLLLLIGAFVSSARLSLVGFIVAHGFYMFLWAVRRWQTHKPGLIGPALTLMYPALIVTAGVLLVTVDAFRIRILGGGATQASNLARAEQFNMALPAIIRKPLFGYGPGGSGQAIGWKSLDGQLSVDNYYLTISADYGVTGLVLFFGMIAMMTWWLSREGIRAPGTRSPLAFAVAAFLAVFLTTRTVLSTPDNNPLVYLVLGLGVALLYDARHDRRITI
nr:O-antigen ligase family protein [Sphingomonas sp. dw_22]